MAHCSPSAAYVPCDERTGARHCPYGWGTAPSSKYLFAKGFLAPPDLYRWVPSGPCADLGGWDSIEKKTEALPTNQKGAFYWSHYVLVFSEQLASFPSH